jgi:hypothetical protein
VRQTDNRLAMNWIVDRRYDLLWFIGGALTGYAMFFLHSGLHLDMLTVWFLWAVFIDVPHFFATHCRTYLDREEWQKRRKLLIGSLGLFFVGPAAILLSFVLYRVGMARYNIPYLVFVSFFNLWAYWHIVRQHYGIMSLYQKKNEAFNPVDRRFDSYLLHTGLLAPFVAFLFRHPQTRIILGLPQDVPSYPQAVVDGNYFQLLNLLSFEYLSQFSWEHVVIILSVVAVVGVSVAFAVRQVQRWRKGLPLNVPKILFLIAVLPLYAYICYSQAVLTAPLLAFPAFVTVYHDVQYFAIIWFYNRNRYHRPGMDVSKYGLAAKITKNFAIFLTCCIAMAAALRLLGCSFEVHPGCGPLVLTSEKILFAEFSTRELLRSLLQGMAMHHYFVDQFIWKPSKDRELQDDLKLNR